MNQSLVEFTLCTTYSTSTNFALHTFFQIQKIVLSGRGPPPPKLKYKTVCIPCAGSAARVILAYSPSMHSVCAHALPLHTSLIYPPCALMEKIPYLETGIPKGHNSAIFFALHYLVFSTLISSPFFGLF